MNFRVLDLLVENTTPLSEWGHKNDLVDPAGRNAREDPPHHFFELPAPCVVMGLGERQFSPCVEDRLRFENVDFIFKEMRDKDIPSSKRIQARASCI